MRREAITGLMDEGSVFTAAAWDRIADAEFRGSAFVGADFSEAHVDSSVFIDCHFERCDLSLWLPTDSTIGGCRFEDCRMLGIDWTRASWPPVSLHQPNVFTRCDLSMGTFAHLNLGAVIFDECRLRDVSFRLTRLAGARFGGSDCRGADFHGADLTGAYLVGAGDLLVDPRSTKLEDSTIDAATGLAILEFLGVNMETTDDEAAVRRQPPPSR